MRRTPRFSAVAESTARFIASLALNCLRNVGPSAVVDPGRRELLAGIGCGRGFSFTQSARVGEEGKKMNPRSWRVVIEARCSARWEKETRGARSPPSGGVHIGI